MQESDPATKAQIGATADYNDVLEFIGLGRYHYFLLLVCGLCLMSVTIEALNMAFVMKYATCALDIPASVEGIISSCGFIGIIVSSHAWGFLVDKWGRVKVIRTSLALSFVCSVVSSMSVHYVMLAMTRFLVGVGLAGLQTATLVYMGEFHTIAHRSVFSTFAAMFLPIGTIYQPLFAWFLLPMTFEVDFGLLVWAPWRAYIVVSTLIVVFTFTSMMCLPESPKFLLMMGRHRDSLDVLRRMYVHNTGRSADTFPVTVVTCDYIGHDVGRTKSCGDVVMLMWHHTVPLFQGKNLVRILFLFYLEFVLFFTSHGFYMWLPQVFEKYFDNEVNSGSFCQRITESSSSSIDTSFFIDRFNRIWRSENLRLSDCSASLDPRIYLYIASMGATYVSFYLIVAVLMQFVDKRYLYTIWISMLVMAAFTIMFTKQYTVNLVILAIMTSGSGCGTGISAVASEPFSSEYRGMALCLVMLLCRIGAVIGGLVIGWMLFNQCMTMFAMFFVCMIFCVPMNYVLMQNSDKKIVSWL